MVREVGSGRQRRIVGVGSSQPPAVLLPACHAVPLPLPHAMQKCQKAKTKMQQGKKETKTKMNL